MRISLLPVADRELESYKRDMQEAFQRGYEDAFGPAAEEILPEGDIDRSLNTTGAAAYQAVLDGERVGGAIVVIDPVTQNNHLDFLFVKHGAQSKGIGASIWQTLETLYPQTRVWITCTPYFEKRNIHFYVNRCGFHIVAFFNERLPDPHMPDAFTGEDPSEGMFLFEKRMAPS